MADQRGDEAEKARNATSDPAIRDAERLRALEERLAQQRGDDRPTTPGMDKFAHANQAWRMVVELVAGLAVGFGIGFGLDRLFGTTPLLLVVFVFLGFAAGIKTMLRTAAEMNRPPPGADKASGASAEGNRPDRPATEQKPAQPAAGMTPGTDPADDERD